MAKKNAKYPKYEDFEVHEKPKKQRWTKDLKSSRGKIKIRKFINYVIWIRNGGVINHQ